MTAEEDEIHRTMAQYVQFLDDQRFDELVDLFVEEGVLDAIGKSRRQGKAELRKLYEANRDPNRAGRVKHLTFNSIIEVAGTTARSTSDFIEIAKTDSGAVVSRAGRYVDTLVRDPDRWRFLERSISSSAWSPPDGKVLLDFGDWEPSPS